MDIVYDVTDPDPGSLSDPGSSSDQRAATSVDVGGGDLVSLGCQEHPETHCFPLSRAAGQAPPAWSGLPWRISKPRFVLLFNSKFQCQNFVESGPH